MTIFYRYKMSPSCNTCTMYQKIFWLNHPDVLGKQTISQDGDEGVHQFAVLLFGCHQAAPPQTQTHQLETKLHQYMDVGLLAQLGFVSASLRFLGQQ